MQRRQAMAHADGHLTRMAEAWREGLLDALAQVEAGLDFADEGDVGESDESCANDAIAALEAELVQVLAAPSGERLRDGRSEEHTSELQSLMRISYDGFCLKIKTQ